MPVSLNGSNRPALNLNGSKKSRSAAARSEIGQQRLQVSDRILELPKDDYPRIGYGMFPPKTYEQQAIAVARTIDLILSGKPNERDQVHITDINHVGKIFDRSQAACFGDWFRQSASIGYPSHLLARRVTETLASLQRHLDGRDYSGAKNDLDFLHDEAVTEMLENWISVHKGERGPVERGWAYLAWKSGRGDRVIPGVGNGNMTEILARLAKGDSRGESNYGLVRTWLVHDPASARDSLREVIAERSGDSSLDLGRMSDEIEVALLQADNLVLSPWHVDDEMAFERLGLVVPDKDIAAPAGLGR
jgi:hypothetical protein